MKKFVSIFKNKEIVNRIFFTIMMGRNALRTLKDGWTAVSKDGQSSAHYENTLLVSKDGYEILTQ